MENICKLKQLLTLILILLTETPAISQNYYPDCAEYYNMDTTNSKLEARNFFEGYTVFDTIPISVIPDKLYNVYKMSLSIPLLSVKENDLLCILKSALQKPISDMFFPAPSTSDHYDSSGYLVDILIQNKSQDSFDVQVSPHLNYYMYNLLSGAQRSGVNLAGCFYYDSLLCIVHSWHVDPRNLNCYWDITDSYQKINIYQKEFEWFIFDDYKVKQFSIRKCN
jgi:hypothetical protein